MVDVANQAIIVAAANERLRQERETFDQRKAQDKHAFALRVTMGWVAVVLLPSIAAGAGLVILNAESFSDFVVNASSVTLGVDVVGIIVSIWRAFAGSAPPSLQPVTAVTDSPVPGTNSKSARGGKASAT